MRRGAWLAAWLRPLPKETKRTALYRLRAPDRRCNADKAPVG